jgi:hypothetical protein
MTVSASEQRVAARLPLFAERFHRLWPEVMGDDNEPGSAQLQLVAAQAWLESGVADPKLGSWWKGAMEGSGNLGAIQCTKNEPGAPHYQCAAYTDQHPNGATYATRFRFYLDAPGPDGSTRPAADWAMLDFLTQLSLARRPRTFAALMTGDLQAYATALHTERYYEGFGATVEERIDGYAKAIASHLPTIADVLDQEVAVTLPSPLAKEAAAAV